MVKNQGKNKNRPKLGPKRTNQLWELLDQFTNVFAWHKGELGCLKYGKHVDTQGFPPCKTTPSRLSFWEEVKVKK